MLVKRLKPEGEVVLAQERGQGQVEHWRVLTPSLREQRVLRQEEVTLVQAIALVLKVCLQELHQRPQPLFGTEQVP